MSFKSSGRCLIIQFFAIAFLPVMLLAQGEDNPTGVTGVYNGNVTTAGNFDPFTGNAMRGPIDDIVMPSSVGAYPLKWTRYLNSRNSGGFWSFSYKDYKLGLDSMVFPDGRVIQFTNACTSGVEESTGKWNGKDAIFLADGGKVLFDTIPSAYYPGWTDMPSGLVDPYGQLTTIHQQYISTDSNGIAHYLVDRITEPGGRYLQINWITDGGGTKQIGSVQAFDGVNPQPIQSVTYTWTQWSTSTKYVLSRADYSDGTSANYQYINAGNDLMTCDDVRYAGPMRQIAYQYLGTGGKLQSENHLVSGQAGEMVSSVAYPATTPGTGVEQRTETRGDGPTRTFAYMKGGRDMDGTCLRPDPANGKLVSYTDFLGHTTTLTYEGGDPDISPHYGFIQTVTDPNGHTTTYTRQANSWGIKTITHPDGSTIQQTFWPNNSETQPYYLQSRTDELNHTTFYTRDANNRITRKDYPDGGFETFTYNNFGEVLTHEMTSGGTETFVYDSRGLKTSYTDATGGTTTYTYYGANDPIAGNAWIDRLKTVTHPANASGLQATESYQYDRAFVNGLGTGAPIASRGLVTKVTHTDGTFVSNVYDIYGQLRSTTDELGHTATHTYDDYGRVLTATDPLNHTTTNSYVPTGKTSSYITTSKLPFSTTLPSGKVTTFEYDANWRKTFVHQAPGTADAANTQFVYDTGGAPNIGHLMSTVDPRSNTTTYGYDIRDRQTSVTDALGHTNSVVFDFHGNKTREDFANGRWVTYDIYDPMNRLKQKTVHRDATHNDVSKMTYDSAGNLASNTDENGNTYTYKYDLMNRPLAMAYPNALTETHTYDGAGNLATYKNRTGAVQTFTYDNRNRPTSFAWSDGTSPQSTVYDAASRKTQIVNNDATINFTYDNANRLLTQEEWSTALADNVHRTVTYTYDADGNRQTIQYPSGTAFNYTYTNRNQVASIKPGLSGGTAVVSYTFDPSGNITGRTLDNGTSSAYTVDAVNRDTAVVHNLLPTGTTKRFDYAYNAVNDVTAVQRDSAKGDGFTYDLTQQITGFQREGTSVNLSAGTVTGGTPNNMTFDGCGNRTNTNGTSSSYNNMNQPTDAGITYDTNGNLKTWNGWVYVYDAQNRLRTATNATTVVGLYYDGLNRQVARSITNISIPNVPVTTNTFSVWDGDWAILQEYGASNVLNQSYVQGLHGLVKTLQSNIYYYQDELGSTSHISNSAGTLLEYYKYDLYGKPTYWNASGTQLSASANSVKDLFTGQRWIPEIGLYDDRNRFMSPDLGRFLQPDPIGFKGDSSNLYRYCGNDWANKTDPLGLNPGDPFPSALAAGVDAVRFINPTSIQQNKEYGGVIYKLKGSYYATKTVTTNEGNKVQVGGEKLPANAQRVGDYHTHGDYSVRDARTGQPVRTGDPRKDSYNSDHLGPTDLTTSHARGQGKSEYTTVVGTPSGKIRSLDGTDPSSKEQEVKAAPGKSSGGSSGGFGWISASSSGGSASGTAGQSIGSYGEQPDGSFVDSQGSNINLAGDGGWSPGTLRLTPAP